MAYISHGLSGRDRYGSLVSQETPVSHQNSPLRGAVRV